MPALSLDKRYIYGYGCNYYGNCGGAWENWVRWLVLGLIVGAAILLFFLFSCLSARRRRRMGAQPYRGTGWVLGMTPAGHGRAEYTGNQQHPQTELQQPYYNNSNNPPPPAYNANENQGWYGNAGVAPPSAAYHGQYEPPKDPPPPRV
ncbi:hypothetical protein MBLNU457_7374t1 [Dothideomycetes sp. NU457]